MPKSSWDTDHTLAFIRNRLISYQECWHIGTLRPEDKGWGSHEGSGLSISLDPDAWRLIANLGGPLYRLEKSGASFVDAYACLEAKSLMREIWGWCMLEHYVERKRIYRIDWYDSEQDGWRLVSFLDEQQAKREFSSYHDLSERVHYNSFIGYVPTTQMTVRMRHKTTPLAFVRDFALTIFVEELLPEVDGIWWQDVDDPFGLSAPRGVIFQRQVLSWTSILLP